MFWHSHGSDFAGGLQKLSILDMGLEIMNLLLQLLLSGANFGTLSPWWTGWRASHINVNVTKLMSFLLWIFVKLGSNYFLNTLDKFDRRGSIWLNNLMTGTIMTLNAIPVLNPCQIIVELLANATRIVMRNVNPGYWTYGHHFCGIWALPCLIYRISG